MDGRGSGDSAWGLACTPSLGDSPGWEGSCALMTGALGKVHGTLLVSRA